MQPQSIQETQQRVLALNSDSLPFQYTASGNSIIGSWKIADVKWTEILGGGSVDQKYSITINLDESSRTYSYSETKTNSGTKFGFNPMTGNITFGQEGSSFSGKMVGKEFGAGLGTSVTQNGQQTGNTYQYSFDTSKIKEPLFSALEQCGWQQKKSEFFSSFFKN